ncbi:MAG TPA: phosphoenolpyruvate--protein phosphotransferase, partial [Firmicutes bacterium]|nr:phosphoenolpyruvate--protein phosphotransferase [Bacillota bacterium]
MIYNGIIGSGGIAIGRAYILKKETVTINKDFIDDNRLNEELNQVDEAVELTKAQIARIKERASEDFSAEEVAIFEAHLMILEDPELINGIKELIINEKLHSSNAAAKVIENFMGMFSNIEDEYLKERAADIRDVGDRLINNLLGVTFCDIGNFDT